MKALIAFLVMVALFTLTACGTEEVEVTREVEVTPVVDTQAEQEILDSISDETDNAIANADRAVLQRYFHKDLKEFFSTEDDQGVLYRDSLVDIQEPGVKISHDDAEWIITSDLAVRRSILIWEVPGQPTERYYSTEVYKKEGGQWYFIHSHLSYTEP